MPDYDQPHRDVSAIFEGDTPEAAAQIVKEQGFTGIDATSGATITSEAIINATAKALAGAEK